MSSFEDTKKGFMFGLGFGLGVSASMIIIVLIIIAIISFFILSTSKTVSRNTSGASSG